jgi:hypothetical protein
LENNIAVQPIPELEPLDDPISLQQGVSALLKSSSQGWQSCPPPADQTTIQQLVADAGIILPTEYLALLAYSDSATGPLGVAPGWFQLWPAKEVLELNKGYAVAKFIPGFFGFGSDGGGELLAFDARTSPPYKVVAIPFIPMVEGDAWLVADTFAAFLELTGKPWPDGK